MYLTKVPVLCSTVQPMCVLGRGSACGCLGFENSWWCLKLDWDTWNNHASLKHVCKEAIWSLQVNYYWQWGIHAQDDSIPSVIVIPESAIKCGPLSVGGKHFLTFLLLFPTWISFHLLESWGWSIQKYSVTALVCLSPTNYTYTKKRNSASAYSLTRGPAGIALTLTYY